MFSGYVKDVSKTKIAVIPYEQGGVRYQVTIYENVVKLEDGTTVAMVLPVPNGGSLRAIDMSGKGEFFDDIDKQFFPQLETFSMDSRSLNKWFGERERKLDIVQVGSYKVSLAHSLDELTRLDFGAFQLDEELVARVNLLYPPSYGYLICQMDQGAKQHPIAYAHQMDTGLFVPTYHYHKHLGEDGSDVQTTDWDHAIYVFDSAERRVDDLINCLGENERGYGTFRPAAGLSVERGQMGDYDFASIDPALDPEEILSVHKVKIQRAFQQNIDFYLGPLLGQELPRTCLDENGVEHYCRTDGASLAFLHYNGTYSSLASLGRGAKERLTANGGCKHRMVGKREAETARDIVRLLEARGDEPGEHFTGWVKVAHFNREREAKGWRFLLELEPSDLKMATNYFGLDGLVELTNSGEALFPVQAWVNERSDVKVDSREKWLALYCTVQAEPQAKASYAIAKNLFKALPEFMPADFFAPFLVWWRQAGFPIQIEQFEVLVRANQLDLVREVIVQGQFEGYRSSCRHLTGSIRGRQGVSPEMDSLLRSFAPPIDN